MNLNYAKPFANTKDLENMTPKIFSDFAKAKIGEETQQKSGFSRTQSALDVGDES